MAGGTEKVQKHLSLRVRLRGNFFGGKKRGNFGNLLLNLGEMYEKNGNLLRKLSNKM